MRLKLTCIFISLLVSGCAMMKDFDQSSSSYASTISLTRDVEHPMLGSTTFVYEVSSDRQCFTTTKTEMKDTRFMVVDDGNPLISDFNLDGVKVEPNVLISLYLHTVAGPRFQYPLVLAFTPEEGKDYQIKLLGKASALPHQCQAELWSTISGTNIKQKEKFESYDDCK